MGKKYLDYNGLLYFWGKIKNKFSGATNWEDGSAYGGSVRTSYSKVENEDYTMGQYATTEGYETEATGEAAHAEGWYTVASGDHSHAEGDFTQADGTYSHAEGYNTIASGNYSHSSGYYTMAERASQTVIGEFNSSDEGGTDETTRGDYVFIIGNGNDDYSRSNALTVDWNGNVNIPSGASYKVNGVPISEGGGGDIFPVVRDSTSYQDIATALTNNKTIVAIEGVANSKAVIPYEVDWNGSTIVLKSIPQVNLAHRTIDFPQWTIDSSGWSDTTQVLDLNYPNAETQEY